MLDVFVTMRLPEKTLQRLTDNGLKFDVWTGESSIPPDIFLERVRGVKGIICRLSDRIDSTLLNAADLKALKSRGVRVGYTPEMLTEATAELTVSLLLSVSRRIVEASAAVKDGSWGTWEPFWMCGKGLEHSTVGILGLGRIGKAVATRLASFSPGYIIFTSSGRPETSSHPVLLYTKPDGTQVLAEPVSFDDLLRRSDFLCVCCAFSEKTRGLFTDAVFDQMKPGAVFVNVSRGAMVDQDALYRALSKPSGGLGGAGLDVMSPEPLPTDSPLLSLPHCVVLPHIGSATTATRWKMAERTVDNLLAGLADPPMPLPSELRF
ncbi:unnamed protein product [Schistocephalus solidus]|uniref:Glyoxylate reductase/hydroxypyruvate reductase n=2 Tax=Schistocephalus solidus TaxID=70667 RepID=A0A183SRF3_SCHSO|nr:unnamed protein product [Schistocephalus solidus]